MTWAEAVSNMTTSPVFFISLFIFLLTVIFVMILGIKKGWIKFRNKNISVGSDIERNIILTQIKKVESTIADFYVRNGFRKDDYKARFISSEVADVLYRTIAINHINTSATYLMLKKEEIWKVICQYSDIVTEEQKAKIYDATDKLIRELVEIREYLLNGGKK